MSVLCPCCNRPMEAPFAPVDALTDVPLTPHERRLVETMADAYPRALNKNTLIEAMYFDNPDDEPDNAANNVSVYLWRLRRKLRLYGWTISGGKKGPGAHSRYRLEPLNAERPAA